jgi:hypothetical protein
MSSPRCASAGADCDAQIISDTGGVTTARVERVDSRATRASVRGRSAPHLLGALHSSRGACDVVTVSRARQLSLASTPDTIFTQYHIVAALGTRRH